MLDKMRLEEVSLCAGRKAAEKPADEGSGELVLKQSNKAIAPPTDLMPLVSPSQLPPRLSRCAVIHNRLPIHGHIGGVCRGFFHFRLCVLATLAYQEGKHPVNCLLLENLPWRGGGGAVAYLLKSVWKLGTPHEL